MPNTSPSQVEPGEGDEQPQRTSKWSKGLKGLKSLNVSGAGEGNTLTWTFPDDDPHPSATTPRGHPVPGPVRRDGPSPQPSPCAQFKGGQF
jgi:hypothetical protein